MHDITSVSRGCTYTIKAETFSMDKFEKDMKELADMGNSVVSVKYPKSLTEHVRDMEVVALLYLKGMYFTAY